MSIDKIFINSFIKATERGAYGASLFVGKGDKIAADKGAVDEMRNQLNKINMKGKIVIGEGEMDEAPMLYINEVVGNKKGDEFDIAVDPLEGTNFAAKNLPNSLSVLAVSNKGNLLQAPDMYMEKIAIGPNLPKNIIDLDNSVEENIKSLSNAKKTTPDKLTACILKRPRHNKIVKSLENLNVKIKFIDDGDVSGAISVADKKANVDLYLGIGGAPEGVLAASALKCLNSQMQTRLVFDNNEQKEKAKYLGITNLSKKYSIDDMVKGDVIFCATGVTGGELVDGIKDFGESFESETYVMHFESKLIKKIKNISKK